MAKNSLLALVQSVHDSYPKALRLSELKEGKTFEITDIDGIDAVQDRDFTTHEPKTFADGTPMMAVYITGTVNGERVTLWAKKQNRDAAVRALAKYGYDGTNPPTSAKVTCVKASGFRTAAVLVFEFVNDYAQREF